jgi:hypothetical protein
MIQQDGAAIARKAEEGLLMATRLMNVNINTEDHAAGE